MLSVRIRKALREYRLEVAFEVRPAETLVIIGPSGCGKTTTLNAIAGLVWPDEGRITLGDRTLWEHTPRTVVPVEKRDVGYVFQDFALFPHLTVAENVAYGLRARHVSRREIPGRVDESLRLLGISHLTRHRPGALSGGERQRVALARAIVCNSEILLLDEPLGSLDAQTRNQVRSDLQNVLQKIGRIAIMVTHDYVDALTFGDKICVMDRGSMLQVGDRHEILTRPRSRFVAELTGVNFFEGSVNPKPANGNTEVYVGGTTFYAHSEPTVTGDAMLTFFPSDVVLTREQPSTLSQNIFRAKVHEVVHMGDKVRISLNGTLAMTAEVTARTLDQLQLLEGDTVFAAIPASAVRTYH